VIADVRFLDRVIHVCDDGTAHCILSFFFNTTVLALTTNIAASVL
jgi:uncharacterized membrane protein